MTTTIKATSTTTIADVIRSAGTGSQFISMEVQTIMDKSKMVVKDRTTKLPNPYLGAIKIAKINGLINVDFTAAVERNMAKAGIENPEYIAGPTWYVRELTVDGKPLALVHHKTSTEKQYIQYYPHRNLSEAEYFLNGVKLSAEQVTDMKRYFSGTTMAEFKPQVRTYALDSIRVLKARRITLTAKTLNRLADKFFPAMELNPQQGAVQVGS